MGAWSYRRVEPVKFRAFFRYLTVITDKALTKKLMEICMTGMLPLQAVPLKRQADTTGSGKTISVCNSTVLFLHFMMKDTACSPAI